MFAATTFCRLLGQALLQQDQSDDGRIGCMFHTAGFGVARHGEAAIREALNRIAAAATGHLCEPNKAFGALYSALNGNHAKEAGFAPFRRLLRDCILDHWPIATGEILLGEALAERRLHSIITAAKETGLGAQVIERFLIEAGAIPELNDRPQSLRMFDAKAYAELLAEIPTLVGLGDMRRAMGATRHELMALEEENLLPLRTRVAKVRNSWRISDGETLVADLLKGAIAVAEDDTDWETLLLTRKQTEVSLTDQFGAIREGRLTVGQRSGVPGFHGIVVAKSDLEDLISFHQKAASSVEQALPGAMSAAEFGRSVGLRDNGCFVALIEAGHTSAVHCLNPKTGRPQCRLGAEDISSFHQRFVTLPTLSEETGYHRNTLKTLLEASWVARFAPDGQDFGRVYLREETTRAVEQRGKIIYPVALVVIHISWISAGLAHRCLGIHFDTAA